MVNTLVLTIITVILKIIQLFSHKKCLLVVISTSLVAKPEPLFCQLLQLPKKIGRNCFHIYVLWHSNIEMECKFHSYGWLPLYLRQTNRRQFTESSNIWTTPRPSQRPIEPPTWNNLLVFIFMTNYIYLICHICHILSYMFSISPRRGS